MFDQNIGVRPLRSSGDGVPGGLGEDFLVEQRADVHERGLEDA